jgi:cytoskeleton protein RodZ
MLAQGTPGGIGSKLREARDRRGVTLREIANATKISMGVLEALERNDITRLPGGIFGRAFVRSYAVEVGLDPEETIKEFIAQFPKDSVTAGHPTLEQTDDHEALESDRRMASAFLRVLGISIPVAGVVLYFVLAGRHPAPRPEPAARAATRAVSSPGSPGAAAAAVVDGSAPATAGGLASMTTATTADASAPAVADHFVVGLAAGARCRVSATVDGQRVIERELQPGERQQLNVSREIVLTAGNAGALTMTIDGGEPRPLGKAGETTTVRLNPSNLKDYLAPR